ncbi:MAG: hypothetical protein NVSMB64_30070 [Candidatus Velthaea sp.]
MTRAVVDVAFGTIALDAVVASAMPANTASRRVLERVGFVFVGDAPYKGELPNVKYRMERGGWAYKSR